MKVLFQDLAGKGGAQASYTELLRTMATEFPDDQYIIVCSKNSFYCSLGGSPNIRVIPVSLGAAKELRRLYVETLSIVRIAKEYEADVVWSTNLGPYTRTGIPQVLMVLNSFQALPWAAARYHPRSRLALATLRWLFRLSLRCCDVVQVEMPFMGECIRRIRGAPQWIEVIAKAVESAQDAEPQPLSAALRRQFDGGLGRPAFTFLFVATCSPHKNQTTVVAATEILRSRGVNARLALSASKEQLRRHCGAKRLSSLTASGHVLPLEWIDKEQLAAVYAASDACVMPSHIEQLSSAHLEAMHWEKPQVCADLPYAHDVCGDAALYADPNGPADWAAKMQTLMEDPGLRERLVAAGLGRMKSFPKSWREVARRERAFLAEVAARTAEAGAREGHHA